MKENSPINRKFLASKFLLFVTSIVSLVFFGGVPGNAGGASEVLTQASQSTSIKSVEELLLIIVSSADEDEIYRAFCELEDINFEAAHQASKDYVLDLSHTEDYIPISINFASCDVSGAARLMVI